MFNFYSIDSFEKIIEFKNLLKIDDYNFVSFILFNPFTTYKINTKPIYNNLFAY